MRRVRGACGLPISSTPVERNRSARAPVSVSSSVRGMPSPISSPWSCTSSELALDEDAGEFCCCREGVGSVQAARSRLQLKVKRVALRMGGHYSEVRLVRRIGFLSTFVRATKVEPKRVRANPRSARPCSSSPCLQGFGSSRRHSTLRVAGPSPSPPVSRPHLYAVYCLFLFRLCRLFCWISFLRNIFAVTQYQ